MPRKAPRSRSLPPGCYWRGSTIWFRAVVKGTEHRQSLRTDDAELAGREAERIRARLMAEAYGGDHRRTWLEAVVAWGEHMASQIAASTAKRYAVSLGQIEAHVTALMIDDIDGRTVSAIVVARQRAGASAATIRRDLTALSSVLEFACAEEWRQGNPALERLKRMKERRDPIVLPADADIERVARRAPGNLAAVIRFALATGCRQEEIVSAQWSQIRGSEFSIVGKGSKRRTITLSPEALAVLASIPRRLRCQWVFWHEDKNGEPARYANVAARFVAIVGSARDSAQREKAEFRPFRFHDLRHRFAVDRLRDGWSLYAVQRHLGHSSVKTTEIYIAHLTPDQEASARGVAQNPAPCETVCVVPMQSKS